MDFENGLGVSMGRLREDTVFDYKFVGLHNTVCGAAGGALQLTAELQQRNTSLQNKKQTGKSS